MNSSECFKDFQGWLLVVLIIADSIAILGFMLGLF